MFSEKVTTDINDPKYKEDQATLKTFYEKAKPYYEKARKLGRDTAHRLAMLRGLVTFFFENGKIETTATRAQEVRALAEKMITIAKEDTLANRRNVMAFITKESVTNKLFKEIAPKYADRNGGYTRITKLGPRRGDAAEMAIIELI